MWFYETDINETDKETHNFVPNTELLKNSDAN